MHPTSQRTLNVTRALALALILAGCSSLHTRYETPEISMPPAWSSNGSEDHTTASAQGKPAAQQLHDAWWTNFQDPQLNQLVAIALQRNADLVTAAWNIHTARLQLGLADSNAHPEVGANISSSAQRQLESGTSTERSHSANLNLSYEADLWGRIASQRDAAQWRLTATEQDLQTTAISLVANVAKLYWELAHQNEQIAASEQSLLYASETQRLVQAQYDAGEVSGLEVQEARHSVASQQSALAALKQTRAQTLNALAVMLNSPPSTEEITRLLPAQPQALPAFDVPDIPAGLPAELLARRPDLQAAESRLRATLAEGNATRASYYPTLGLTASLGSASSSLRKVLSNPVGSIGAALTLPFLQYNEMRLNTAVSRATYEAAVVAFEQSLYTALQEVEDALSNRQLLAEQMQWHTQQLDAARKVEELNAVRYHAGATALKSWLDAQESRRNAELAVSATRLSQLLNQLTLYKALGGDAVFAEPGSRSDATGMNTDAAPDPSTPSVTTAKDAQARYAVER